MITGFQVIPFGFEPKTYCLEGSCSIQLSYGTRESVAFEDRGTVWKDGNSEGLA